MSSLKSKNSIDKMRPEKIKEQSLQTSNESLNIINRFTEKESNCNK